MVKSILLKQTLKGTNYIFWQSLDDKEEDNIELGLAHGQAMILFFLTKTLEQRIETQKTEEALHKLCNLYIKNQIKSNDGDYFPDAIEKGEKIISPLRWCHGHLGIALSLWKAGKILRRNDVIDSALQAGIHASMLKSPKKQHLPSAIICHGTLGVAHMFNRFFQFSYKTEFKEAALYWYSKSLEMMKNPNIHVRTCNEKGDYEYKHGIINGIEGIGLSILACLSDNEPKWDRCILLS